mmetsp:Transcript_7356/g.31367  ORF Transcript_7356/g.31367 Transcript_7356/m.31367 type:complete len:415 (+) Transcript_7356:642-1886(+)
MRSVGISKPARRRVATIARNASCTSSFVMRGTAGLDRSMPSSSTSSRSGFEVFSTRMSTSSKPSSSNSASSSRLRNSRFLRSNSSAFAPPRAVSAAVRYCSGLRSARNSSSTEPNRSSSACPKMRGSSSSSSPISSESYPRAIASNMWSTSRASAPRSAARCSAHSSSSKSRSVPASEPGPRAPPPPPPNQPPFAKPSSSSSSRSSSTISSTVASASSTSLSSYRRRMGGNDVIGCAEVSSPSPIIACNTKSSCRSPSPPSSNSSSAGNASSSASSNSSIFSIIFSSSSLAVPEFGALVCFATTAFNRPPLTSFFATYTRSSVIALTRSCVHRCSASASSAEALRSSVMATAFAPSRSTSSLRNTRSLSSPRFPEPPCETDNGSFAPRTPLTWSLRVGTNMTPPPSPTLRRCRV